MENREREETMARGGREGGKGKWERTEGGQTNERERVIEKETEEVDGSREEGKGRR